MEILCKNFKDFFKALYSLLVYWLIAGPVIWMVSPEKEIGNLNGGTLDIVGSLLSIFGFLLYVWLGSWFFKFKASKGNDIYGSLEITLGMATFIIPFLSLNISSYIERINIEWVKFILEILIADDIAKYLAFYSGIYLMVRGYESIYKHWLLKSEEDKKKGAFLKLFTNVETIEKEKKNEANPQETKIENINKQAKKLSQEAHDNLSKAKDSVEYTGKQAEKAKRYAEQAEEQAEKAKGYAEQAEEQVERAKGYAEQPEKHAKKYSQKED